MTPPTLYTIIHNEDYKSTDYELHFGKDFILVPALLKWIGNKQKFAETIVSYMPESFNNYYEPFMGSGAVLAELLREDSEKMYPHFDSAYGSDILPFLIDIFVLTKENPEALDRYYEEHILDYYKNPDEKYLEIRNRFNSNHNPYDFLLLSRTCYSGVIRFRKSDGYMSTPKGPHIPIKPEIFHSRIEQWNELLKKATFQCESYESAMNRPQKGDIVYCDPPYTHSQSIIYGAQKFNIESLWQKIAECKARGVKVMLSINGTRDSQAKDISATPPDGLFERRILIDCGVSMIDRLQNTGKEMKDKVVSDQLFLTW